MARKKKNKEIEEVLTFNFKGDKYLYDGILSFFPVLIEDDWIVVNCHQKVYRLPFECMVKAQLSDGRAIYVISDRKNKVVADYIYENMSYLATRDGISGKKWDDLIKV